jgi:SIT4 phosphatase-associated protein
VIEEKAVDTTATTADTTVKTISEPEPEEEDKKEAEPEDEGGKFMLLERLFRFIRSKETPLNPVLAGYFAKLFTILINRRQKQLIPRIFSPDSDVLDCLLYHVYQKSLSEILIKLLNISHHDFESGLSENIRAKQSQVVVGLIDKLGSSFTEEHNLNAASILVEMLENKEYFNLLSQRQNIAKLVEMSFVQEDNASQSSQKSAISLLIYMIPTYLEKRKDDRGNGNNDNDDEDSTIQEVEESAESPLVDILAGSVPLIALYLSQSYSASRLQLETTYDSTMTPPLGFLRIKIIELVLQMLKMNKKSIIEPLAATDCLAQISKLVEAYPWNNFLQLKVQNIYEEVLESVLPEYRAQFLAHSDIGPTLIKLSQQNIFEHQSKRPIRHGYMALVVKVANLLQKHRDISTEVREYLENGEWAGEWQ